MISRISTDDDIRISGNYNLGLSIKKNSRNERNSIQAIIDVVSSLKKKKFKKNPKSNTTSICKQNGDVSGVLEK